VIKLKKILNLSIILLLVFATAFSSFAAGSTAPVAKDQVLFSLTYGEKDDQIVRDKMDEKVGNIVQGPTAYTVDEEGNAYIVDSVKHRVLKLNASDKKVTTLFTFEKSNIRKNMPMHIEVTKKGFIYLDNPSEFAVLKFSADGKQLKEYGYVIERQVIKELDTFMVDEDSNVIIADKKEPKVAIFSDSGELKKEIKMKEAGMGFARSKGKIYTIVKDGNSFKVIDIEKPETALMSYTYKGESAGDSLINSSLAGISASGKIYVDALTGDPDGKMEDQMFCFTAGGKFDKKMKSPYAGNDDEAMMLPSPYVFARDGKLLHFFDTADAFQIKAFE